MSRPEEFAARVIAEMPARFVPALLKLGVRLSIVPEPGRWLVAPASLVRTCWSSP